MDKKQQQIAQSDIQRKFMRRVRFGKSNHTEEWDRRMGKTHTLLKLVSPILKRQHKKVQYINISAQPKIVCKDTQIVLLDEFSRIVYDKIRKKRPDIRIIGLTTSDIDFSLLPTNHQEIQFE
jgi:hypothetical protein